MKKAQMMEIKKMEAMIAEMDRHIVETEQTLTKFKDTRQKIFTKLLCYKYTLDLDE